MAFITLRRSRNTSSYYLVESYRDEQGRSRKRTLCYLGREQDGTDTLAKALDHWLEIKRAAQRDLKSARSTRRRIVQDRVKTGKDMQCALDWRPPICIEWEHCFRRHPMTIARAHLVDPAVTRWYHCVTRCVRRAFLLGEGPDDRKLWIDQRLGELARIFSVAVGGFSVIDLNPVAAGIAKLPEASEHTSIKERVEHVKAQGRTEDLKAARNGSVAGSNASAGLEESHWLCPIEDRRRLDSLREGMLEGFSLGSYVLLVDYTGRLFRDGKAAISREVAEIFNRLGSSAETWQARLQRLSKGRLFGRFFAASRERLKEVAERLGLRRVPNLGGCPAT
jgi:hypothetical protein